MDPTTVDEVDVLIVGAGISGIGAACHLRRECPDRTWLILEARDDIGGTWDLFRYPGVRSDSDMHTLGFDFKPWTAEKAIADGPSIMSYLRETIHEHGLAEHIRLGHRVRSAEWDSPTARWTVTVDRSDGASATVRSRFVFMCAGYYSYEAGHQPAFPGVERFRGAVVHPQHWPSDFDHAGKRIVVIGSGATAMTIVPAMADTAAHVTMLQRTPTWVVAAPDRDRIANALRQVLPDAVAYRIVRWKNTRFQQLLYARTRSHPEKVEATLLRRLRRALPPEFDVERHFHPPYHPWDQRLCLVPNGDLFTAIREGRASVVTDRIRTFTEEGIELESGEILPADVVVTATGLELLQLGGVRIVVDGSEVDFARTWSYKGFAYSDVPNLASSFGYVNASWTLRSDLTGRYVCRLMNHLRDTGTDQCTPRLRDADADMPSLPWIQNFTPGYMQRVMHLYPRQGDREPWVNPQNYRRDRRLFAEVPVDDGVMQFTRAAE